jgi:hypothetical protein
MTLSSFHLETEARTIGLDHSCFEKHCLLCLEGGQKELRRPCPRLALLHVSVRLHRTSKIESRLTCPKARRQRPRSLVMVGLAVAVEADVAQVAEKDHRR